MIVGSQPHLRCGVLTHFVIAGKRLKEAAVVLAWRAGASALTKEKPGRTHENFERPFAWKVEPSYTVALMPSHMFQKELF